jgi:hypothetical protein
MYIIPTSTRVNGHAQGVVNVTRIIIIKHQYVWFSGHASQGYKSVLVAVFIGFEFSVNPSEKKNKLN